MECDDYEAIRGLMNDYARYVDDAEFEKLGRLLDGAMFGSEGALREVDAEYVREWYSATNKVHGDGTLRTCHVCSNVTIRPGDEPGTARARSYFVVLQEAPSLPLQPIVSGRYSDRFSKRDGEWRFTQRAIEVRQIGNMSEHLPEVDLRAPVDREAVLKKIAEKR